LLSLASSPLSQTPPLIPAEISRSPEKTSLLGQAANNRSNGGKVASNGIGSNVAAAAAAVGGGGVGGLGRSFGGQAPVNEVFGGSTNGNSVNAVNGVNGTNRNAVPRSPPASSSRSPGNAFNFTNGPVSPNGMTHSTSFKERMAAAQQQQQQQQQGVRSTRQNSDGAMPSSGNSGPEETNGAHADEQFNMEM
jgi:hypothetical protein